MALSAPALYLPTSSSGLGVGGALQGGTAQMFFGGGNVHSYSHPSEERGISQTLWAGLYCKCGECLGKDCLVCCFFCLPLPSQIYTFFPFPLPVIHFDICEGKESIQTLRPSFASLSSFFARAYLMGKKDRYQSRKSPPTKFPRARIPYWNGSCRLQTISQDQLSISIKNILKGGSIRIDIEPCLQYCNFTE